MKNLGIKLYLHTKSIFRKEALPKELDTILEEIKDMGDFSDFKVCFNYLYPDTNGNGATIILRSKKIRITKLMVYQYVKYYNTERYYDYKNALRITKGHEMSHTEDYPLPPLRLGKRLTDRKMVCQLNEVHADFSGTVKMANSSRQCLIDACKHKKRLNDKDRFSRDNGDFQHPSWRRRIEYAENYNFDEKLFRRIAADTNCHNEELIQECIKYFEKIIIN